MSVTRPNFLSADINRVCTTPRNTPFNPQANAKANAGKPDPAIKQSPSSARTILSRHRQTSVLLISTLRYSEEGAAD